MAYQTNVGWDMAPTAQNRTDYMKDIGYGVQDETNQSNARWQDYQNYNKQQGLQYQGLADQAYGVGQGGLQGYSPEQVNQILGLNATGSGLQGVNPMTPQQAQGYQLTPEEQQAMQGNPQGVAGGVQSDTNQYRSDVLSENGLVDQAAQGGAAGIRGAINPNAIGLDPALQGRITGALGQEQQGLASATTNPNLGLSQQFQQNYQFGDQDAQKLVTQAGEQVGARTQAGIDQATLAARAQGETNPLAMAALRGRLNQQGASQADQAMLGAEIGAKQQELGVAQQGEEMRLGTAQDISSRQLQAAEALGGQQIGAAQTAQQQQIAAAEAGQGLNLQANVNAANLGLNAREFGAGQVSQANQYGTTANMQAGEYADTNAANRAAAVAQNRQGVGLQTQQIGYNQGMGVNQAMSGRYSQVANQQQNQQGQYRNYLTGQQGQANQNWQTAQTGQQSSNLQTAGLRGQLTQTGWQNEQPGVGQYLGGAALGFAQGFGQGFGKTKGFARGGVVKGPTTQKLGIAPQAPKPFKELKYA